MVECTLLLFDTKYEIFCSTKIRNIEATEEAKQKLLDEKRKKKNDGIIDFIPTNMAVNFVQHKRCKLPW